MSADLAATETLVHRCCGLAERALALSQMLQSAIDHGITLAEGERWAFELRTIGETLTECLRWLQDLVRYHSGELARRMPQLPVCPPTRSGPVGALGSDLEALIQDLAKFEMDGTSILLRHTGS